jgi:hypothetical protein
MIKKLSTLYLVLPIIFEIVKHWIWLRCFKQSFALRAEPGLGESSPEIEPHDLNISRLTSRYKKLPPGLWQFMRDITKSDDN